MADGVIHVSRRSAETDFLPANTLVLYVYLCLLAQCMASVGWDVIEGAVATEQWIKHESLTLNGKNQKASTRGEHTLSLI